LILTLYLTPARYFDARDLPGRKKPDCLWWLESMEENNNTDSTREKLNLLEARLEGALQDESALAAVRQMVRDLLIDHPEESASVRALIDQSLAAEKIDLRFHSLVYATLEDLTRESATSAVSDIFGVTTVIPPGSDAPSAESRAQVGSILRDRFVLRERVAEGFLGTVFKAQDKHLADAGGGATWVAVKIIQPQVAQNVEALKILQQEAAKSRCLVHNHIVRFIDLDREDEILFTVADWIDGKTLASTMAERGGDAFSVEESLELVRPLASALDYAHRCGVIHGDVKPDTVMISADGSPLLIDFGLARLRHLYSRPGRSVQESTSTSYSSMQILTGETPDARDDVFSLACLLYRLVAGHRVFGPRNAAQAAEDGMQAERPPGLSTRQWDALSKALAFARVSRPGGIREFMAAIDEGARPAKEELQSTSARAPAEPGAAAGIQASNRSAEPPGRRYGIAWVAAVIVLAAIIITWLWPPGDSRDSETLSEDGSSAVSLPVESPQSIEAESALQREDAPGQESTAPPPGVEPGDPTGMTAEDRLTPEMVPEEAAPGVDTAEPQTSLPDPAIEDAAADPGSQAEAMVDIVEMPAAGLIIPIGREPDSGISLVLTLREDEPAVVIEITRSHNLGEALYLQLAEVAFTGNRSPLQDGQYLLLNEGRVDFAPGQTRRRLQIVMRNDTARESDRRATLALVDRDAPDRVYATLSVLLEDDDQRRFEAGLPTDTIAFSASQVASRENLPAVQIEVLRLNAGSGEFATSFTFADQTAVEGQDYFVPTQKSIRFQPGQRNVRLFIPLVQDSEVEGDETFLLELEQPTELELPGVNRRVTVLIRDDDEAADTGSTEDQ
jgi:serine/threonine protein kinase